MENTKELIEILTLEKKNNNIFIGQNTDIGSVNVYGGLVLAQSLSAAYQTIDSNRIAHSIHANFLEPGNKNKTIEYRVIETRDGGSFSNRVVNAFQDEKQIFSATISFNTKQLNAFSHSFKKPFMFRVPMVLFSFEQFNKFFGSYFSKSLKVFLNVRKPIEFKIVEIERIIFNSLFKYPPKKKVWFRFKKSNKELDYRIVQQMLLFASDLNLLLTALEPHPFKNPVHAFKNLKMASLDHSMWFHKPFDSTEWLLYDLDSPILFESKGFTRGLIYTKSGELVASVAQEGLIRINSLKN